MFDTTREQLFFPKGPARKKNISCTPFAKRKSLMVVENLPKPTTPLRRIIHENVYQEHSSSSDEDLLADRKFKSKTEKYA